MKVLITGGSGLIGRNLTSQLLNREIEVVHLTRSKNSRSSVKTFEWDWKKGKIDEKCFDGITHIVHLAGAPIDEKAWTMKRKHELVDSRVETAKLLYNKVNELDLNIEAFVSASGVGYYGAITDNKLFSETDEPFHDFIAKCCVYWEKAADQFKNKSRVVKLRTGIVLDKQQGAFPKMSGLMKIGFGSALSKGKQWMPWVSIDDIVRLYIFALQNKSIDGVYNAVANNTTNLEFTKTLASAMHKRLWMPNVPAFVLKGIYGELADILLEGSRIDNTKIKNAGFIFEDNDLQQTLEKLIKK